MNKPVQYSLRTRQELVDAAVRMIDPLVSCLTPGKARMIVGEGSAHYPEDVAGMEGFSRVLWALVPMMIGKCPEAEPYWRLWREGLINGTDPDHEEYWGDIHDYDQRMVEMAVIGTGLCFLPDRFYGELTAEQQGNLYRWLNQINLYDMPKNNWRYFRILVNTGFLKVGLPVDEARLKEDLDMMEGHYVGDGWYFDYPTKRDYYTIWGFHYYSLVYAAAMKDADPERCRRFIDRAKLIAPRFACWFDREGRALPYGRSLTYRFAQGSFWSAMAFAGVTADGLGWGEMKGMLLGNLRFWLGMPIFDRGGALMVGYGYPNLCAAEGYNAPGSPYWGMKAFFALALPEDHPFWQAEEKQYTPPARFLDEQVRLLLTRDAENRQVIAYTAGNHAWEHMHEDEKYEKFAYSTQFAFSVIKEATTLQKGAFDSMLAVKHAGKDLWHGRSGCETFELSEDQITFTWSPMEGVMIDTVIVPVGMWHVRKHVIRAEFPVEIAEGAFAVRRDWAGVRLCDRIASVLNADESCAQAHGAYGTSAIFAVRGYDKGEMIWPEPNTNLMWPRTVLPMLRADLPAGESTLVCAVYADAGEAPQESIPREVQNIAESL
ncbi:MAG: DUF2264 domain-containing protein [Clostridia bacterium]|nr:DUF2264 domain-containing protein [Clostridia bacterium]